LSIVYVEMLIKKGKQREVTLSKLLNICPSRLVYTTN